MFNKRKVMRADWAESRSESASFNLVRHGIAGS